MYVLLAPLLLGCTEPPPQRHPGPEPVAEPQTAVAARVVDIRVSGPEDYASLARTMAELEASGESVSVQLNLAAGTYDRTLSLGADRHPVDITLRGEDGVWFTDAKLALRGRDITLDNVGFRGRVTAGSLLSVEASGDVTVRAMRAHDIILGSPPSRVIRPPPGPAEPGERRRQARGGKRTLPSYVATVGIVGTGSVVLQDIVVERARLRTSSYISVHAPNAAEIILEDLVVPDDLGIEPFTVSPAGTTVAHR